MDSATEPNQPSNKRVRFANEPASQSPKRNSSPTTPKAKAFTTLQTLLSSLPETVQPLVEKRCKEYINLRLDLEKKREQKHKYAKDDQTPSSAKVNFAVQFTERVKGSSDPQIQEKLATLTTEAAYAAEQFRSLAKSTIRKSIDVEIEVLEAELVKSLAKSVGEMSLAFLLREMATEHRRELDDEERAEVAFNVLGLTIAECPEIITFSTIPRTEEHELDIEAFYEALKEHSPLANKYDLFDKDDIDDETLAELKIYIPNLKFVLEWAFHKVIVELVKTFHLNNSDLETKKYVEMTLKEQAAAEAAEAMEVDETITKDTIKSLVAQELKKLNKPGKTKGGAKGKSAPSTNKKTQKKKQQGRADGKGKGTSKGPNPPSQKKQSKKSKKNSKGNTGKSKRS